MSQNTNEAGRTSGAAKRHELGLRVARLLAGAWREPAAESAPVNLSESELTEITPLLCQIGAGAIAWSRIANVPLAETDAGKTLREVYRRSRLASLVHERELVYVLSLLHHERIKPVLIKGWAISRLYPDRGLRPYGDIDLCVAPVQFAAATKALQCLENIDGHYVDLHCGFDRVGQVQRPTSNVQRPRNKVRTGSGTGVNAAPDSTLRESIHALSRGRWTCDVGHWTALYERSQEVLLNGTPVHVPSAEDHLRLLCTHLLRSGARRPAWLCDIGLLVESRKSKVESEKAESQRSVNVRGEVSTGNDSDLIGEAKSLASDYQSRRFDWDTCLGNDPVQANWIAAAIALARDLLGANIDDTPFAKTELPRWLAPAVLQQWGGRVKSPVQSPASKVQLQASARRHWTLDMGPLTDLYSRWDNPIRSVAAVGGEFGNWPRFPYQLAESIKRLPAAMAGRK